MSTKHLQSDDESGEFN